MQLPWAGCPSVQWAAWCFALDGLAERICPASMAEGSLESSGDLGWTLRLGCLNHGDGKHQWETSWLLWESWPPSQADRQVALVGLVRSRVALEGLRWVGRSRGGPGCCSLHPACLFLALSQLQLSNANAENAVCGKCPLINNLRVFSLSGSDILHFSSLLHQPKTFNDVVFLMGCAAHAKYLQPSQNGGQRAQPGPVPLPCSPGHKGQQWRPSSPLPFPAPVWTPAPCLPAVAGGFH